MNRRDLVLFLFRLHSFRFVTVCNYPVEPSGFEPLRSNDNPRFRRHTDADRARQSKASTDH